MLYACRARLLAEAQSRVGACPRRRGCRGPHSLTLHCQRASAVLQLVRRMPLPDQDAPRVVGVDDRQSVADAPTARSWRTWTAAAACWICCPTVERKRWRTGFGRGRASWWLPAPEHGRATPWGVWGEPIILISNQVALVNSDSAVCSRHQRPCGTPSSQDRGRIAAALR